MAAFISVHADPLQPDLSATVVRRMPSVYNVGKLFCITMMLVKELDFFFARIYSRFRVCRILECDRAAHYVVVARKNVYAVCVVV
ncbi:hypothetical protein BH20ACI2_BH20ACI2_21850 [soil metagenome]